MVHSRYILDLNAYCKRQLTKANYAFLRVPVVIGNLHFDALPTAVKPVLNIDKCTAGKKASINILSRTYRGAQSTLPTNSTFYDRHHYAVEQSSILQVTKY